MKKMNYVFLLLCSLIAFQTQAQITIGVKGGYTNAWENYGDARDLLPEDAEIDVDGFNVSLIAQYQIGNRFNIGIEPGLTRRGAACFPGWVLGFPAPIFQDNDWNLTYVELPVIASYSQPIIKNSLDIVGKLGGGIAYLAKGVEIWESDSTDPAVSSITDEVNRWDYGIHTGLDIRKHLGKHQIVLGSDIYVAFKDVDKTLTSKNRSIDVNLGYLYTL
jgi:hypothetical protein